MNGLSRRAALALGCLSVGIATAAEGWGVLRVPGAWEQAGIKDAGRYEGFAWYRCWLKPAPSFFNQHERDLYAESVVIYLRGVAGAYELFVNGAKIGTGGSFPPGFENALLKNQRHKIPAGLLLKDEWNEIALRFYKAKGEGGFAGEAPFVMNYFDECELAGEWEFRLGDDATPTAQPLKERPPRAAFDQYHESHRVLGEPAELVRGPRREPTQTLAAMHPAPGLRVELLVSEPFVAQPTHLSYDERGRMWVSEFRQYPYPAGLRPVSRDKYYRTQYDRVPPPPPRHDRGRDRVTIHEDTDGDGEYDRHKVFQDGLNMANASLRGAGGVWIMHTPYLLFYPDADFDDVPDGPPVVHLQGYGLEDSHAIANGLVWGVDGWIYGAQGSTTAGRVRRPGLDDDRAPGVYFEGCMVWRYHPRTRAYEIFAEGGGNNFGLEIDDAGRLSTGHNGGGTRGWLFLQGGSYAKQEYQPGKIGPPHRPYAFGELPMLHTRDSIRRFTHHLAWVGASALPAEWQGRLLAVDPLHSLVTASRLERRASAWATGDLAPALTCDDSAFRPVFIAHAPDGSLHVADFYDHYIAHGQHYQGQIDPDTGRVFRLRGRDQALEKPEDLSQADNARLLALLDHPNRWHRHTAVRVIGERADPSLRPALVERLSTAKTLAARCALWALHQGGGLGEAESRLALSHPDPVVRAWAVRLLGDAGSLSPAMALLLAGLAGQEPDAEVRAQLASSARRLPPTQSLPMLAGLLAHEGDLQDDNIPHLIWWALEAAMSVDRNAVLAWLSSDGNAGRPVAAGHLLSRVMRRLAEEGGADNLRAAARLLREIAGESERAALMEGFEAAFQARPLTGLPDELLDAIAAGGPMSLSLRVRRREAEAIREALQAIARDGVAVTEKRTLIRCLGELAEPAAMEPLLGLALTAGDPDLRLAAIAALGGFADETIATRLLDGWKNLPHAARRGAAGLLVARPAWALAMLRAVQEGRVAESELTPEIRLALARHGDKRVVEAAERLAPAAAAGREDLAAKTQRLRGILAAGAGNPYAGEGLFRQRCASCHTLFGQGGRLGPDLTLYQRDDLGTMLTSILDPNAEIREGYQFMAATTRDGRVVSGFLSGQDARRVVMRGLDGADHALDREAVLFLEPMGRSLMPDGLLDDLEEQQVRDLLAFLRSPQPISK